MGNETPGRVAIVSDIHGNLEALRIVLADLQAERCDRIVCLGDMVDGGEGNDEVVRLLRDEQAVTVLGNHDEYHDLALAEDVLEYLAGLPETITEGDAVFTHISPRAKKRKVNSTYEAWSVFEEVECRIVFVGHVHIPLVYGQRCEEAVSATVHPFEFNVPYSLDPSDRYLICVGAVGYPRDGINKIRYGIWDQRDETLEIRALDGPQLPFGTNFNG
jgi:predicted phosphodiesterase